MTGMRRRREVERREVGEREASRGEPLSLRLDVCGKEG
jgi:hypothetical protein